MKRVLYIVTAALLVSSCSVFGKYSRPEVSTENIYGKDIHEAEIATTDTVTIADICWRTSFRRFSASSSSCFT